MHLTIVGAGALGQIYGVRLAAAGVDVAYLVRAARAKDDTPFIIEQATSSQRRDTLAHPRRVTSVPRDTDAVLVAVRFDQILADDGEDALIPKLRATRAPIVVLTPLLPAQHKALDSALGRRCVPAMPSVAGYAKETGLIRYWVPAIAATLLEERQGDEGAALELLARRLSAAGISAGLERDVSAKNGATTIAFFPLIAAIDPAGSVDRLLGDAELLSMTLEAAHETEALSRSVGKPASWTGLLTRFIGPFTLKAGVALARRIAPEAVHFVEEHFGPKLHGQHLAMGEAIRVLADEHGVAMPALDRLLERVREARGANG
jgi:2-dehydropantoate 2-reductase